MIGTLLKFFGLGSGISLWAYAVVFGIGLAAGATPAYVWEHRATIAADAERDASKQLADLNGQDAQRWHDASDARDKANAELRDAYAQQSAAVEAGRKATQAVQAQLDAAQSNNTALQSQADQLSAEIDAEVKKAPGDVRTVGPIVAKRVGELFK